MDWRTAIGTAICVAVLYVLLSGLFAAGEGLQAERDAARAAAQRQETRR